MNQNVQKRQIANISKEPGVYIFKDKSGNILYVGKAVNLRNRVGSYFNNTRNDSRPIMAVLNKISKIETRKTSSVLEALILEANLIKKYQPKYNVLLKDDKSFSYVVITKDDFPRVLIVRESDLEKYESASIFGPFVSKKQLEITLKIIRKIFPFHSRKEKSERGCLEFQIDLCPGPYAGKISKSEYRKNIQNIKWIFSGRKKGLIGKLEKEMKKASDKENFEMAAELRNKIFALEHIQDISLISEEDNSENNDIRIEAYDISNISGKFAVGSMVVFEDGEMKKSEYRKFKIKTIEGANDVGMLAEVLWRRFQNDWAKPDLILLDGGKGQLNVAKKVLSEKGVKVFLAGVAKGKDRKGIKLSFSESLVRNKFKHIFKDKKLLKKIMDESHRFAVTYHKQVRKKAFFE